MPINNSDYLYEHLPARFRRDDPDLFLKRFLSWFGEQADGFDADIDGFYQKIAAATAPNEFIEWWLWALFGWGWFPQWFVGDAKRAFYAAFATHLARRGTARGIREFLAAFGVHVYVDARPRFWGESFWGEPGWTISGPLGIVVSLRPEITGAAFGDQSFWGESFYGETWPAPADGITLAEIIGLLRFQWPIGQILLLDLLPVNASVSSGGDDGLPLYGEPLYGG